jgi:transcriptional regulator with XRE-family HTH domain
VAQLAGISVDYYIRLEQGRGPRPSRQVLAALGRALLLTLDERTYLFDLAGEGAPPCDGPSREVPVAIRHLLASLEDTPAYVLDAKYDVLAWNRLATFFIGDLGQVPEGGRNVIRWTFTAPLPNTYWDDEQAVAFARSTVADLRAAAACYPGDRGIHDLVAELLATSSRFAEMWAEHEVAVRRTVRKAVEHPLVGRIEMECQVLHIPDSDQRLVVYVAEPGSRFHEALRELRALSPALDTAT